MASSFKSSKSRITSQAIAGEATIDRSTESIVTLDYAHHEIHAGDSFFISGFEDLANSATASFLFVTPDGNKLGHFFHEISAEAEMDFFLYEGTVVSPSGSAIPIINRNRNSATTSSFLVFSGSTVTSFGDILEGVKLGSGKKAGGVKRGENEIVLNNNTKYLCLTRNVSGGTAWVNFYVSWYEHTDKNQ